MDSAVTAAVPMSVESSRALWKTLRATLPRGTSEVEEGLRTKMFKIFDVNGVGRLSVEDVLAGCINVLGLDKLTDSLSSITRKAFTFTAKIDSSPAKLSLMGSEQTIDVSKFRALLVYIYNYFEIWFMFAIVDTSGDRRIELDELKAAAPSLAQWGLVIADIDKAFKQIDDNGSGYISFDEFSDWANRESFHLEGSMNQAAMFQAELAGSETKPVKVATVVKKTGEETPEEIVWNTLVNKLPLGKDPADELARTKLFKTLDWNNGGSLNLSELQTGCQNVLQLGKLVKLNVMQQIVRRSHKHLKLRAQKMADYRGEGKVSQDIFPADFREVIKYIFINFQIHKVFQALDKSGDGRIEIREMSQALPVLESMGVKIGSRTADELFNTIDDNKSGFIMYDELGDFACRELESPIPQREVEAAPVVAAPVVVQVVDEPPPPPTPPKPLPPAPVYVAMPDSPVDNYFSFLSNLLEPDQSLLPPADVSYSVGFIDATLTQCITPSSRLPRLTCNTASPLRGLPHAASRVVPLLIQELHTTMQVRQRLHLQLFYDSLEDFLTYDDTTDDEWEALLVVLFGYAYRRGGLTPLQTRHNDETSDICFLIIHSLLGKTHQKYPVILRALRQVMLKMQCSTDDVLSRPNPPPQVKRDLLNIVDYYENEARAVEIAEAEVTNVLEERSKLQVFASLQAVSADFLRNPYFYSIDCLPSNERMNFCERDYLDVEAFFLATNPAGPLDSATNSTIDLLSVAWPVVQALENDTALRVVGRLYITDLTLQSWRASHPDGLLSITDVLRTLFPYVPERTILRRVHGVVMIDEIEDEISRLGPNPTITELYCPTAQRVANGKLSLHQRLFSTPTDDAALAVAEWFDSMDYLREGKLTLQQLIQPRGCLLIGCSALDVMELGGVKGGSGPFVLADVLRLIFPTEVPRFLDKLLGSCLRRRREADESLLVDKEKLNKAFGGALAKYVKSEELLSEYEENTLVNPAGDVKTKLMHPLRRKMVEVSALLEAEYDVYDKHSTDLNERRGRKASMQMHRRDTIDSQRRHISSFKSTDVPTMYGPDRPPHSVEYHGLVVNKHIFMLDHFANLPESRSRVVNILTQLDASRIYAGYFLSDPAQLHHYVPHPLCGNAFVYRDFAFASSRPGTGSYWTGNHVMHIKTSIRQFSGIKFRFHLEGYNFGVNKPVNTIVVGYAAKGMIKPDSFEAYGWPDGWDKHTILHKAGGIEHLTHYFSTDGFLTFHCTARSFSKVGFSISAWFVCQDYGSDHQVWAEVIHQENRL